MHRRETCRAAGVPPDYGKDNQKIKLLLAQISARWEVGLGYLAPDQNRKNR